MGTCRAAQGSSAQCVLVPRGVGGGRCRNLIQRCKSVDKVKSSYIKKEVIPVNTDERFLLHQPTIPDPDCLFLTNNIPVLFREVSKSVPSSKSPSTLSQS